MASKYNGTLVKYTLADGTKGTMQFDHVLYLNARKDLEIMNEAHRALTEQGEEGFELTDIKPCYLQRYAGFVSSL